MEVIDLFVLYLESLQVKFPTQIVMDWAPETRDLGFGTAMGKWFLIILNLGFSSFFA